MALTQATKVDKTFKLAVGKSLSDTNKQFYEELIGSGFIIPGDAVWIDPIPYNDPAQAILDGVAVAEVDFTLTKDTSVAGSRAWQARATPGNLASPLVGNWLGGSFGNLYSVRVYQDNGVGGLGPEIPSSDASEWIVDERAGTLFFQGSTTGFVFPLHFVGYRYVGQTAAGGSGGLWTDDGTYLKPTDGTPLYWNHTVKQLALGGTGGEAYLSPFSATLGFRQTLHVDQPTDGSGNIFGPLCAFTYSDDVQGSFYAGAKSRGTMGAPTIVQPDDALMAIGGLGYNGAGGYGLAAVVELLVDPAGSTSATSIPGMATFGVAADGLDYPQVRMALRHSGALVLTSESSFEPYDFSASLNVRGRSVQSMPSDDVVNGSIIDQINMVSPAQGSLDFFTGRSTRLVPNADASPFGIMLGNRTSIAFNNNSEISSTATSGGVNTLTDTSLSLAINVYVGATITLNGGTGSGQWRTISANTTDEFTVVPAWSVQPDATTTYEVSSVPYVQVAVGNAVTGGYRGSAVAAGYAFGTQLQAFEAHGSGDVAGYFANLEMGVDHTGDASLFQGSILGKGYGDFNGFGILVTHEGLSGSMAAIQTVLETTPSSLPNDTVGWKLHLNYASTVPNGNVYGIFATTESGAPQGFQSFFEFAEGSYVTLIHGQSTATIASIINIETPLTSNGIVFTNMGGDGINVASVGNGKNSYVGSASGNGRVFDGDQPTIGGVVARFKHEGANSYGLQLWSDATAASLAGFDETGMTQQWAIEDEGLFRAANGDNGTPSLSFYNAQTSGFFWDPINSRLGSVVSTTVAQDWGSGTSTMGVKLGLISGTADPDYSGLSVFFNDNTDSGWLWDNTYGYQRWVVAGAQIFSCTTTGLIANQPFFVGPTAKAAPSIAYSFRYTSPAHTNVSNASLTEWGFEFDSSAIQFVAGGSPTTIGAYTGIGITQRTINRASGTLTITDAATLKISGAPIAGTGVTLTNSYAVWSDAGLNRFDGDGSYVFELPADATGNATAATGRIPVKIGGATKYIRYFDD